MDEHPNESIDLQNPDEERSAKRVRLEAPLAVTEEVQQEVMGEDDWDDIYGEQSTPKDSPAKQQVIQTSDPASNSTLPSEQHEHQFGVTVKDSDNSAKIQDTSDGIPPEAISEGDNLVAPPPQPAPENNDKASIDVMEETTETEYQQPVPVQEAEKEEPPAEAKEENLLDQLMADVQPSAPQPQPKASDDPEFMQAAAAQKGKENAEWQFNSSDDDSSDSDSTDSDDTSSDDDDSADDYEMLDPATAAKILMAEEKEEGGGESKPGVDRQPRTQNEVKEEVVPKPDIKITPEMKTTLLGHVQNVVENMLLIKGVTPGEYQVLERGSVLCDEHRNVVGAVAETFGKVQEPMYSMAFNSAAELKETGLEPGLQVFYVDDHSEFVFTQPLKSMKYTDASNIHDEEIGPDELEFSDDEKEAEFKRHKKLAKKTGQGNLSRTEFEGGRRIAAPARQMMGGNSDAPSQTYGGAMNYDDDEPSEDLYQPLKRPENLSQLMAGGAASARQPQFNDRGRGRGRGDRGRGRGDRGRGDRGRGRGGFEQRNQRGGQAGGFGSNQNQQQGPSHRGNAQSFPDNHNNPNAQPSYSPQAAPTPQQYPSNQGYYQQQPPQTYQFNGYQFQYGNQPATQYQQYGNYGQQTYQQPTAGSVPAGAHVNPAFFQQQQYAQYQQQQQQPAQQQNAAGAQQASGQIDFNSIIAQLQNGQQRQH